MIALALINEEQYQFKCWVLKVPNDFDIEFLTYIQTQTAEFFGFWVGACVNPYNNPYVKKYNTT